MSDQFRLPYSGLNHCPTSKFSTIPITYLTNKTMADLKKVLNKLVDEKDENLEEISSEELEELEGGINVGCAPQNSSCTSNTACPSV
jgi:hypothetical protein